MSTTSFTEVDAEPVPGRSGSKLDPAASSNGSAPWRSAKHKQSKKGRAVLLGTIAASVPLLIVVGWWATRGSVGEGDLALVFHTVTRGDLPITVTERGNLESQRETRIVCEVETVPGQSGIRIVSIVPNGKSVGKGDLLVELDSAPITDRLDNQVVAHEQARAAQIQANAKYENQITQNETSLAAAHLKVELAELGLEMYQDKKDGTYQITRQDLELKIQEAKNQIIEAQAGLLLQATARNGMEMLYKLGYRGRGDFDQAVFKSLQTEDGLVKATNTLANAVASLQKFEQFEHPMKKMELGGARDTARRGLLQVERDNESLLAQAQAAKIAADRGLVKEEERRKRYEAQLERCKIYAPHEGMAAHSAERTPWGMMIGEGVLVYERTKILSLPDLTSMQVKTAVHESVLDEVHEGLRATIKIDAFPDHTYQGTVGSLAVLPSQGGSYSSDVKVYETIVRIDEKVDHLKPGMTAVVEIHVDRLRDILTVPVQAVVQVDDDEFCYVENSGVLERRQVTLGRTNDKFVQIIEGLEEGDRVVLNPMTIAEKSPNKARTISSDSGQSQD